MILERGWFIRTRGGGGVTHLIMVYDGKIQIYTTGTGEYDALDTVLYFAWVVACFGCCALLVAVAVSYANVTPTTTRPTGIVLWCVQNRTRTDEPRRLA